MFRFHQLLLVSACFLLALLSRDISIANAAAVVSESGSLTPLVMWHGMGDFGNNPLSMGRLKSQIESDFPGLYIVNLVIGASDSEDQMNGFFKNVNDQIQFVCQQLAQDPKLLNGFNAMGFSQGGQFLRAYVERCNSPRVLNLISVGGQHQGIFGLPHCVDVNTTLCDVMRNLLNYGAYIPWIQNTLVQAEYWHTPLNEVEYQTKSVFLADINNEGINKNQTYKQNLLTLNNFVMVKFSQDSMVIPVDSEWFGWYENGNDKVTVPLQQTQLYTEDWIGLKQLDDDGKLVFLHTDGDHLQFSWKWFQQNIEPFINTTISTTMTTATTTLTDFSTPIPSPDTTTTRNNIIPSVIIH